MFRENKGLQSNIDVVKSAMTVYTKEVENGLIKSE